MDASASAAGPGSAKGFSSDSEAVPGPEDGEDEDDRPGSEERSSSEDRSGADDCPEPGVALALEPAGSSEGPSAP